METERIDDEREEVFIARGMNAPLTMYMTRTLRCFHNLKQINIFSFFFLSIFYYIISKFNKLMKKKMIM